jgi:hypothetical protein
MVLTEMKYSASLYRLFLSILTLFLFRDSKVIFQTLNLLFLHVSNTDLLFKVALRLLPSEDNRATQTQRNFTPPTCHDTAIPTSWQIKTGRTLHGTDTGISPEMIYWNKKSTGVLDRCSSPTPAWWSFTVRISRGSPCGWVRALVRFGGKVY